MSFPESRRTRIVIAFAVIYVVWGSTFLATRWVVEEVPPFLAFGMRFALAGAMLLGVGKWRGEALPRPRHWPALAAIGVLLFVCGSGSVVWAQSHGLASGTAALLVATVPLWLTVLARVGGERTPPRSLLGLAVGFAGTALLVRPGGDVSWHASLILIGTLGWASGSLLTRRLPNLGGGTSAAAAPMLCGGVALVSIGSSVGELERWPAEVSTRAITALMYLVVVGSVLGFRAYTWLLAHVAPAKVGTYAFVNPLVAVVLGAAAGEPISFATAVAMALVVIGVVCTVVPASGAAGRADGSATRVKVLAKPSPMASSTK